MTSIQSEKSREELSVVVPVYNEEENVRELIERTIAVLEQCVESFEIILADDGSTDATTTHIREYAGKDDRVKLIRFSRNFGQEAAVQAGFLQARGEWVLQMDGDLQNPPEEIPKLLEQRENGFEVVWGFRHDRQDSWPRRFASWMLTFFMKNLMGISVPEDVTTFRLLRADIAKLVAQLPEKKKFLSALIVWSGAKAIGIPVQHSRRIAGKTKYNFFKLINHTIDLIVGFTIRPLRIMGVIGGIVATGGLGYGIFSIFQKLMGVPIEMGFTSLMSSITILGGLNLITLAIVGEYVGRVFVQLQDRPLYLIDEFVGFDQLPVPQEHRDDKAKGTDHRMRISSVESAEILQDS